MITYPVPEQGAAGWDFTPPEGLQTYYIAAKEPADAPTILLEAVNAGPFRAITPVAEALSGQANVVVALGDTALALHLDDPTCLPSAELVSATTVRVDRVLITPSRGFVTETKLLQDIKQNSPATRVFLLSDYYCSAENPAAKAVAMGFDITVFESDTLGETLLQDAVPDVPIEVTGSPAHDSMARLAKEREAQPELKEAFKSELGIADKKLLAVFFPGAGSLDFAKRVQEALPKQLPLDVVLTLRFHAEENPAIRREIQEIIFAEYPTMETGKYRTEQVIIDSDVVLTGRSTVGSLAIAAGQQVVHFLQPEEIATVPIVAAHSALQITQKTLWSTLQVMLQGEGPKWKAYQEMMTPYKADGGAAARVAERLLRDLPDARASA